jgi:HD-like signal output (HDOD) protein
MSAQEYAKKAGNLFLLPQTVTQIKTLLDDEASSMEDIADLISNDPTLTAHILRIANSALYNFAGQVDTITKAVQVIGTQAVYDFVIALGVSQTFRAIPQDVIDLDRFWERSVMCSLLCKFFADKCGLVNTERMFVVGLLHNIGELVMVQFSPDQARKCAAISDDVSALRLQQEYLGFSYAQIGATLIREWGIADCIPYTIERQHVSLSPSEILEVNILQLASILATESTFHEFFQTHTNIEQELYEKVNLDTDDLEGGLYFSQAQKANFVSLLAA